MKLERLWEMPNPHLLPDENDPSWYCQACERKFAEEECFIFHIELIHKIKVTVPWRRKKNPNLMPDVNDQLLSSL
jgi:hypothetical protein